MTTKQLPNWSWRDHLRNKYFPGSPGTQSPPTSGPGAGGSARKTEPGDKGRDGVCSDGLAFSRGRGALAAPCTGASTRAPSGPSPPPCEAHAAAFWGEEPGRWPSQSPAHGAHRDAGGRGLRTPARLLFSSCREEAGGVGGRGAPARSPVLPAGRVFRRRQPADPSDSTCTQGPGRPALCPRGPPPRAPSAWQGAGVRAARGTCGDAGQRGRGRRPRGLPRRRACAHGPTCLSGNWRPCGAHTCAASGPPGSGRQHQGAVASDATLAPGVD